MLNSLRNCQGVPTIFVPTSMAMVPYNKMLLGYMWREMKLAGVPGLHIPSDKFLW